MQHAIKGEQKLLKTQYAHTHAKILRWKLKHLYKKRKQLIGASQP